MIEDAKWKDTGLDAPELEVQAPAKITISQTVLNTEQERFFKTANRVLNWAAAITAIYAALCAAGYGLDSTDVHAFNRSGVALRRDNMTGCEYLEGRNGGLTPRLTGAGLHMGCRQ